MTAAAAFGLRSISFDAHDGSALLDGRYSTGPSTPPV